METQKFLEMIAAKIASGELQYDTDNTGQIMFYTGLYHHRQDEQIHSKPDPNYDDDYGRG